MICTTDNTNTLIYVAVMIALNLANLTSGCSTHCY